MVILDVLLLVLWYASVSMLSVFQFIPAKVPLATVCAVVADNLQPAKVEPLAGVCHLSPVLSELSATN
jgi:hypothetical protein